MDAIDLRLLDLLRLNARVSVAELARQVGLSPPAVHERVAKLEQSKVIRGYRADISPEAVGLGVTALVGVVQSGRADGAALVAAMREITEIDTCLFVAGPESYMLKVRVASMGDLEHLIVRLGDLPGVESTRTTVALSVKWEDRPPPALLRDDGPRIAPTARAGARRTGWTAKGGEPRTSPPTDVAIEVRPIRPSRADARIVDDARADGRRGPYGVGARRARDRPGAGRRSRGPEAVVVGAMRGAIVVRAVVGPLVAQATVRPVAGERTRRVAVTMPRPIIRSGLAARPRRPLRPR